MVKMNYPIGFIQGAWQLDIKTLENDPPFSARYEQDRSKRAGILSKASRFDKYRELKYMSILLAESVASEERHTLHIMVDDTDRGWVPPRTGDRTIIQVKNEAELVELFWRVANRCWCVAGWNIRHLMWPMLIMKAMHYQLPVSDSLICRGGDGRSALMGINRGVVSLEDVYTSGIESGSRPIPELLDLAEWLGAQANDASEPLTRYQLASMPPEVWRVKGVRSVSNYLEAMKNIANVWCNQYDDKVSEWLKKDVTSVEENLFDTQIIPPRG
jgi:hypothetical protein